MGDRKKKKTCVNIGSKPKPRNPCTDTFGQPDETTPYISLLVPLITPSNRNAHNQNSPQKRMC